MIAVTLAVALAVQQPADTARGAGRPCEVAIDSMARAYTRPAGGTSTNYFGGGGIRAHCKGTTTTLAADTMAYYSALGRLDLLGQVRIRDTTLWLDANFVSYFTADERLQARNNVVAVNRKSGSVLRGPNLTYLRAVPGVRDTVEMFATARPTVEYRQAGDSGEPYLIVGDRLRFKGDDRVWGGGRVTVDRSDFASRSDSLLLDETQGLGVLVGHPRVEGKGSKTYTLTGTRIELGLERREVRLVKALGEGKATGDDWTLTADTIHLRVDARKLQQAFAWGKSARPHAVSSLYTIQSDSLVIDTPNEVLTESRAFGRAFSTAQRDSTSPPADMDWITGDTLTTRFVQERDSTGRERSRLQQIHARGSARALTHHFDERDRTATPAINYSRGQQIAVALKGDRIDRVVVAGGADGVHLEPRPPAPAAADTTKKP
ncbi:MAG TPA: hypothetical protein VGQ06_11145 [Gemmatimonadales bacterium]|nr:hypothetical protein [Gemmatimonadales bacterium]